MHGVDVFFVERLFVNTKILNSIIYLKVNDTILIVYIPSQSSITAHEITAFGNNSFSFMLRQKSNRIFNFGKVVPISRSDQNN